MEYLGKLLVYPHTPLHSKESVLVAEIEQVETGGVLYLEYDENWVDNKGNKLENWKETGVEYDAYRNPPPSVRFIKDIDTPSQNYIFIKREKQRMSAEEVKKALKEIEEEFPNIFSK